MAGEFALSCGRKIGPFDCCSVVQGDCLELMKQLPDGCVDAVITDPPYGVEIMHSFNLGPRGKLSIGQRDGKEYPPVIGNDRDFDPSPLLRFPLVLMWGANHYSDRLPRGKWLIWDKRCGKVPERTQADCEIAWVSKDGAARVFRHMWDGMVRDSEVGEERQHPTQKPVALMAWCVEQIEAETILDPYAGSGTTLVAAKKLGRHFLGFEISPEYCDIARQRIALVEAQPNLFEPKAEQLGLI